MKTEHENYKKNRFSYQNPFSPFICKPKSQVFKQSNF